MRSADEIIESIAATLGSGEDALLFRRGLRRHVGDVTTLRERGLTWDQIARKLTAHGVRHKRGQPVSPHQLRTEYGRLRIEALSQPAEPSAPARVVSTRQASAPSATSEAQPVFRKLSLLTQTRVRGLEIDE